jgi:hypothetical protein
MGLVALATFVASTATGGDGGGAGVDSISGYLSYGPLGLMVIGFLTGQLVPGRTHKRTEDENERLRHLIEDKLLPLVAQNTAVTEEAIRVLGDFDPQRNPPRRRSTNSGS